MLVTTSLKKSTNYFVRYFHVWSTFPLWNFINSNSIITQETLKCLCCWTKNAFYLYCPFSEYFSIIKISESCFIYRLISGQFSRSVMSDSVLPRGLQNTRPPCPSSLPGFTQTHVQWVSDATNHLILCRPLLLPPSIFPASGSFPTS